MEVPFVLCKQCIITLVGLTSQSHTLNPKIRSKDLMIISQVKSLKPNIWRPNSAVLCAFKLAFLEMCLLIFRRRRHSSTLQCLLFWLIFPRQHWFNLKTCHVCKITHSVGVKCDTNTIPSPNTHTYSILSLHYGCKWWRLLTKTEIRSKAMSICQITQLSDIKNLKIFCK